MRGFAWSHGPHKEVRKVAAELSAQEDPKFKGHRTTRCLLTVPRDLEGELANTRRCKNTAISKQAVVDFVHKAYKELSMTGPQLGCCVSEYGEGVAVHVDRLEDPQPPAQRDETGLHYHFVYDTTVLHRTKQVRGCCAAALKGT
jgi:hypothetical protein